MDQRLRQAGRPDPDGRDRVPEELARDLEVLRGGAPESPPAPRARRRRRRWPWWVGVLVLVAAAGFALRARHFSTPEVEIVAVSQRDLGLPPVELTASGYIVARRQITVSSRAQGKIVEMPAEESERVEEGDLIARIENDEQRASLALAQAEQRDSQRELARTRELHARGTVSQFELDRAETTAAVAAARLELARVALANTVLRAPIDGTVIRKIRDIGEFVTIGVTAEGDPGTAVAVLADLSVLDVELEIGETEIRKVALGDVALVAPESRPDRRYLADVIEIAAMADRQKGVVPVDVRIREPDVALLPDMTANVSFLEREPVREIEVVPALPASAVVDRDGRSVVFRVGEDDVVSAVRVETRPGGDDWVALAEALEAGTYVVLDPPPQLESGDRVEVASQ